MRTFDLNELVHDEIVQAHVEEGGTGGGRQTFTIQISRRLYGKAVS